MWVKEPFFVFKQMGGVCVCVCVRARAHACRGRQGCWWWDVNSLSSFEGGIKMHMHFCADSVWQGGVFLKRPEDVRSVEGAAGVCSSLLLL